MNSADAFQQQMHVARREYVKDLPQKIRQIQQLSSQVYSGNLNQDAHSELYRIVHNLAGSGATFGFTGITEAADVFVGFLGDRCDPFTDEHAVQLDRLLNRLKNVCLRAQATLELERMTSLPEQEWNSEELLLISERDHALENFQEMLEEHGYSLRVVPTGNQKYLENLRPAAIIVDLDSVPVESMEFPILRGEPLTPVLVVSSQDDFSARLRAVRLGAHYFFQQPSELEDVTETLNVLTAHRLSQPFRILVVDDDDALAEFYALSLRREWMSTRVCKKSEEALAVVKEFHPELILLDVHMPGCSGYDLVAMIRQQKEFVDVPIILVSWEKDVQKTLALKGLSVEGVLKKPVQAFLLTSLARLHVQRSRLIRMQHRSEFRPEL